MSRSKRFRENLSLSLQLFAINKTRFSTKSSWLREWSTRHNSFDRANVKGCKKKREKEREKEKNKKKKIASLAREKERRRHARSRKERNLMGEHPRRDFHIHN